MEAGAIQRHSKDTPDGGLSCTGSLDAPESLRQSSQDWSSEKCCLGYTACCLPQEHHCFKLRIGQHGYTQTQL